VHRPVFLNHGNCPSTTHRCDGANRLKITTRTMGQWLHTQTVSGVLGTATDREMGSSTSRSERRLDEVGVCWHPPVRVVRFRCTKARKMRHQNPGRSRRLNLRVRSGTYTTLLPGSRIVQNPGLQLHPVTSTKIIGRRSLCPSSAHYHQAPNRATQSEPSCVAGKSPRVR
jgi:hypothetical protein